MSLFRVINKFNCILSKHQKFRIAELSILMIIGGFLELFSVSLVLPFMTAVMNPEEIMAKWYIIKICNWFDIESSTTLLVLIALVLAVLYILKNIYLLLEYNIQYRFTYGNMLEMQKRLLNDFLERPYEYFLNVNSGEIIRVVSVDVSEAFYILLVLLEILTEVIVSVMLIISLFVIAPDITAAMTAIIIILMIFVLGVIKPIMYRVGVNNQKSVAGMNKWLLQSIQGIKEIKIMNKEMFFKNQFEEYGYRYIKAIRRNQILTITPKFIIEAISMSSMFILVAILIYKGGNLKEIVPLLTAVAMAAIRLLPSVNRISSSMAEIAYREPKLNAILDCLNENKEENNSSKDRTFVEGDFSFKDSFGLDCVTYAYPGTKINILKNADLKIKKGESVGLVGASGSGKTTTVDILLGLLDPIDGKVVVDETDIINNKTDWSKQIGYIPQNIFMLDDSIKSNVAFGVKGDEIDEDQVWEALREASLDDFIKTLPDQIETQIGERGVRLSGGQKQRIGIARALYTNPGVIIFDEATSALDSETESEVMNAINGLMGKRTIIIIAHRLTTIEKCDHIYRVQDGMIIKER